MMKKQSIFKVLSVILTACMFVSLSAPALVTLSAFIEDNVMPLLSNDDEYVGVGDLKPPTVEGNPYDVDIEFVDYPVINDYLYWELMNNGMMGAVNTWEFDNIPGFSPYYTTSITPLYTYRPNNEWNLDSGLPYREGNEYILQPDLTFRNAIVTVDMTQGPDLQSLFPQLSWDQIYFRAGMTGFSGTSELVFNRTDTATDQRIAVNGVNGPQKAHLDVPFNDLDKITDIDFIAHGGSGITDTHFVLIDNTAPSVTGVDLTKEGSELVLKVTFSEGLRWDRTHIDESELDSLYLKVLINGNGYHEMKLYISELGGENNNELTFKGELGDYQYVNFTVEKIIGAGKFNWISNARIAVMDVAEKMYYTPVNYIEYGHKVTAGKHIFAFSKAPIADYAGNPIDFSAIEGRRLSFKSAPNSFEAEEVIIYNNYTSELDEQKIEGAPTEWPKDIDKTHMFAGPDNTLTVKMTTLTKLTSKECKQVFIELNVKTPDGNPVVAQCTSSYSYTEDETVYGNDKARTLTCLMFEGIELSEGMTMDLEEGEVPQIKVVRMFDEIPNKTAYPYVKDPSRQLFGDFTAPTVETQRLFMTEPEDGKDYYLVGIKATVSENVENPPYYSGTLQTFADISLSGTVNNATDVRYVVGYKEISSADLSKAFEESGKETAIPINGSASLGTFPVPSDRQDFFIYLMIESGGLLVDGLSLTVNAEDLVGNSPKNKTHDIDCIIDEVAPIISFPKSVKIDFKGTNDTAEVTIPIYVTDYNDVVSLRYAWNVDKGGEGSVPDIEIGENGLPVAPDGGYNGNEIKWYDLEITRGQTVNAEVKNTYGGLDGDNVVYSESLWVYAEDGDGNVSEVIVYRFNVSTEKPATNSEIKSDPNKPTSKPEIIVTGAPTASYDDELKAYTRVTITPANSEWQYVTVVETGEVVDLFSFEGRQWYRVKRNGFVYEKVEAIGIIDESFTLTEDHGFYPLFTYYGDLKISFENGYGNMTPVEDLPFYETASSGSYIADPNYYTIRYTARNSEVLEVNDLKFGQMIGMVEKAEGDLENDPENYLGYEVLKESAEKGESSVLFNAPRKRINPMRGTQIYFTISNVLRKDWGLMDVDFDSSYIELHRIDASGDTVVDVVEGLAGTAIQAYTVPDKYADGGDFVTGQYYVRVYVISNGGSVSYFDSSSMVLDANTPQNDGLWSYSYQLPYGIEGDAYQWIRYSAEDQPYASAGISVSGESGEMFRNRMFAVYTSGVTGFQMELHTDVDVQTYDGITVGEVEGFRYWNRLSDPTDEELEAHGFTKQTYDDSIFVATGFDSIYTEKSIPKGADGLLDGYGIYLVKGVNTICYQIKMENGYVSPVKQFTIIVTDYTPDLNVVIDNYVPSHFTYQGEEGITNAHSIKLAIESAYSLNGSGEVDVSVVGTYGMTVGKYSGEGEERTLDEQFYSDPTPDYLNLDRLVGGLHDEDYVIITQNSYTANYPPENDNLCTAVIVALDEYGGMTVVAPQIGDHARVDNWGGSIDYEYNISYDGGYRDDPYTVGRELFQIHTMYNQPVYFGKQVLGYQNLISYNNGEWQIMEEMASDLSYNLFNIVTNDVTWGSGSSMFGIHNGLNGSMMTASTSGIRYSESGNFPGNNFELINWDSTVITFSGGDLAEPVTVPLAGGVPNAAGYVGGSYYVDKNGIGSLSFELSSVPLPEGKTVRDLPELDQLKGVNPETGEEYDISGHFYRSFTIKGYNIYGDYFEKSGQVAMFYAPYGVAEYYERVRKNSVGSDVDYIEDPDNSNYVYVLSYNENMTTHGIDLKLSMPIVELGGDITLRTGRFDNGEYRKTVTDFYGNSFEIVHTLTEATDSGTKVTYSNIDKTSQPIEITIERDDGKAIYIDVTDYEVMSVVGNGQSKVTVTVLENIEFTYKYDNGGEEVVQMISVDSIAKPELRVVWNYSASEVLTNEETGERYRYGSVTAYVVDDNFSLTDRYSGELPSVTFYPGDSTQFVFEAGTILAKLGDETVVVEEALRIELPIKLYEIEAPLGYFDPVTGEKLEDMDTPNVQILAYYNQNGYFADQKLALQIENSRRENVMKDRPEYTIFEYSGNRASAAELLDAMGWGTAFRFKIEINDMSRTRLFVKEGLYSEAPDYETGYSDSIEGVKLNSRILDVTKVAKFTLFIVDEHNNATAISFDAKNVGLAPAPTVVKVPLSHDRVRVYVIPPEGIEDGTFRISSEDIGVEVKVDEGDDLSYRGLQYVEYTDNDNYIINYSFTYNGNKIEGIVDASIVEINVLDIRLAAGGLVWSDNKAFEATDMDVIAELTFTQNLTEIKTTREIDSDKVRFEISGNTVTVTYLDNYGQIELVAYGSNGTRVPVILDAVTNIDRSAPEIEVVSKVLAENGLSVTITMRSNERALFREGGYVGDLGEDGYYYYTRRVTENATYKYHFADMTGLITVIEVEVGEIVTDELAMLYSTSRNGDGAVEDPSVLDLKIGDMIYVKPSRDSKITFNGGAEIEAKSTEWTAIEITAAAGNLFPYISAVDSFGNLLTQQFSQIKVPDGTPPVISVIKYTYSISVGSDRAEVEAALLANFNAYDDDANITYEVEFTEDLTVSGVTEVTYIATDSAGNVARATGRLRIASGAEPWVYVNGEQVDRDASVILKSGSDVKVKVDASGRPYRILIKEGVKTVAQMKIGATEIVDYTATTEEIALGELKSGTYYTLCVITQDRDYFRIIIYVE